MNKFSSTVLGILDRAISGTEETRIPKRGQKLLSLHGKHGAKAVIEKLQSDCARAGKPQPEFKSLNVAAWNAEIERLRDVLEGTTPAASARPAEPGPATVSAKVAVLPAPVAKPAPALTPLPPMPSLAPRYAALKGLDALNVSVRGDESDEVLNVKLTTAKSELAAKQQSYEAAMKEYNLESLANPEPSGSWDCDNLAALIESVFGKGVVAQIVSQPSTYDVANPLTHAQLKAAMVSPDSPKGRKQRFEAMRSFVASTGCNVPGLSLEGLSCELMPEMAANPKKTAIAQTAIDAFVGVLAGDVSAARSTNRHAADARSFIEHQTRKPFVLGAVGKRQFPAGIVSQITSIKKG